MSNENLKSEVENLKDKLFYTKKSGFKIMNEEQILSAHEFCESYKSYISKGKTERLCVREAIVLAQKAGFSPFDFEKKYTIGDKFYFDNRGKSLILGIIGKNGSKNGFNITAAHIDSPKIDLKPCPIYEDKDIVLFKTHYYGGIRKYQWTAIPLELHGIVIKADGTTVEVSIGADKSDPVFTITDLLPHLAKEQNEKKLGEAFTGENLNVLAGSAPFKMKDDKTEIPESIKLNILNILNNKYGIIESDLITSELTFVPNFEVRDVGLDRSLIGAYGQDDRVCAFAGLAAILDTTEIPDKTALLILADKEETGSDGTTGMKSAYFESIAEVLCNLDNVRLQSAFDKSFCLSADVNVGVDPNYPEVSELRNAAFLNYGTVITKYTGAKGKSDTSDATAEVMAKVCSVFSNAGVIWQTGELGKCDQGGGGTVAKLLANRNIDTVDLGVPVLSMHSPFEITSKIDIYMTYRGIRAFILS